EANDAAIRLQLAGKRADQRRLAGTVRADDGVDLAGCNRQRYIAGRDEAAKALGQPAGFKHRLSHAAALRSRRARTSQSSRTARPGSGSGRAPPANVR